MTNIKLVARPTRFGTPFKIDEKGLTRRSVPGEEHGATPTTLPVDLGTICLHEAAHAVMRWLLDETSPTPGFPR